ncbi:hypothetical protein DMENIID0001_069770 [Sergentomyia squamirostris]
MLVELLYIYITSATPIENYQLFRTTPVGEEVLEHRCKVVEQLKLEHLSSHDRVLIEEICGRFHNAFYLPGDLLGAKDVLCHEIPLLSGTPPISIRQYRLPEQQKNEIRKQVREMLEQGIIEPSVSAFNSPAIIVKKKDGSARVVFDFRGLNKNTVPQHTSLPLLDDIIAGIGRAGFFSVMDLKSGYLQLQIYAADREKTAFTIDSSRYQFRRMCFGLTGAPMTFTRAMNAVLGDLIGQSCYVFLDDILVFGNTASEHNQNLIKVLERLQAHEMKIHISKCQFIVPEVDYLGYRFSKNGYRPGEEKTQAIVNYPSPRSVRGVRQFLGLINYFARFMGSDYGRLIKPITALLKKNQLGFVWNEECERSFRILKDRLIREPILKPPDLQKRFRLTVDGSKIAIGAMLSQEHDGTEHPVMFGSNSLTEVQARIMSAVEIELWAIVHFCTQFRYLLLMNQFDVLTDCKPISFCSLKSCINAKIVRWRLRLSEFNMLIHHKPGKSNVVADALSRVIVDQNLDQLADNPEIPVTHPTCAVTTRQQKRREQEHASNDNCGGNQTDPELKDLPNESNVEDSAADPLSGVTSDPEPEGLNVIPIDSNGPKEVDPKDRELIRRIIAQFHDHRLGGHFGQRKTIEQIRRYFKWPNLQRDISEYIMNCRHCMESKNHRLPALPMKITETPQKPYEVMAIDIQGPFSPSHRSEHSQSDLSPYVYILSCHDAFSKFLFLVPMTDQTAETVARALVEEVFLKVALIPRFLLHDQGTNFCSKLLLNVTKLLQIDRMVTTPYRPQSNGSIESTHRFVNNYIRAYLQEVQGNWHLLLPYLTFAYNTMIHGTTGFAPVTLITSIIPDLPERLLKTPEPLYTFGDYVTELKYLLQVAYEKAREYTDVSRGVP